MYRVIKVLNLSLIHIFQMGCPVLHFTKQSRMYIICITIVLYRKEISCHTWLYATGGRAGEEYGEYCKKTNYEMR